MVERILLRNDSGFIRIVTELIVVKPTTLVELASHLNIYDSTVRLDCRRYRFWPQDIDECQ